MAKPYDGLLKAYILKGLEGADCAAQAALHTALYQAMLTFNEAELDLVYSDTNSEAFFAEYLGYVYTGHLPFKRFYEVITDAEHA